MLGYGNPHPPDHPHRTLLEDIDWESPPTVGPETSFEKSLHGVGSTSTASNGTWSELHGRQMSSCSISLNSKKSSRPKFFRKLNFEQSTILSELEESRQDGAYAEPEMSVENVVKTSSTNSV